MHPSTGEPERWGRPTILRIAVLALGLALTACGGKSGGSNTGSTPTSPSSGGDAGGGGAGGGGGGTSTPTITITAAGVSPRQLTVPPGSRVTFVNNDSRPHDMASDPHPEHTRCPEVNVGFIQPGESRATLNLNTVRVCGFHDHDQPFVSSLQGTITVQ
jgi:plastocyanin